MSSSVVEVWGSGGTNTNPGDTKAALGWLPEETPPASWENYIRGLRDTRLNYLLENGVPEWSADNEYSSGAVVRVSEDGYTWVVVATTTISAGGSSPSWRSPGDWFVLVKNEVSADVTFEVGTGGDFETWDDAWNAVIAAFDCPRNVASTTIRPEVTLLVTEADLEIGPIFARGVDLSWIKVNTDTGIVAVLLKSDISGPMVWASNGGTAPIISGSYYTIDAGTVGRVGLGASTGGSIICGELTLNDQASTMEVDWFYAAYGGRIVLTDDVTIVNGNTVFNASDGGGGEITVLGKVEKSASSIVNRIVDIGKSGRVVITNGKLGFSAAFRTWDIGTVDGGVFVAETSQIACLPDSGWAEDALLDVSNGGFANIAGSTVDVDDGSGTDVLCVKSDTFSKINIGNCDFTGDISKAGYALNSSEIDATSTNFEIETNALSGIWNAQNQSVIALAGGGMDTGTLTGASIVTAASGSRVNANTYDFNSIVDPGSDLFVVASGSIVNATGVIGVGSADFSNVTVNQVNPEGIIFKEV